MTDASCAEEGCVERTIKARGLCNKHYLRRWSAGALAPMPPRDVRYPHGLTNVDLDRRRADCATCGPGIPIRVTVKKSGKSGTRFSRECARKPRHGPQAPERRREEKLKYKYGITVEEYDALRGAQGGRCALCGADPEVLCVDHCHATGRVRGLLCSPCNTGIGHLRDDVAILRRAIEYLTV